MGPWGYVLANNEGNAQAIATVKYNGQAYLSRDHRRPAFDPKIDKWPEDAKGLRISFADAGSTSGWLIPTHYFMTKGIDPKAYFQYRDGASHAAQVISVVNEQTDLATDYDRNLNVFIDRGTVKSEQIKIVWRSDPLPNDPLVVRAGLRSAR